ncbi:MAG: hypothetical protein IBX70_13465 [Clostridia bacterium]|nr:hypothetical protein [Clostridia bacterium]
MAVKIKAKNLAETITSVLEDYSADVMDIINEKEEEVGKEGVKELARISPEGKRTRGDRKRYKKSWRKKTVKPAINAKKMGKANTVIIYSEKPNYRLTHLLEKGHLTRSGKRTKSFPHLSVVEKTMIEQFSKRVGEAIKND